MAYVKTNWVNGQTPINDTNLNKIEQGIYDATITPKTTKTLSDSDVYACNYINDVVEDVYSTTEVKTNKIWKDGKPIYRTVIDKGDIAIPSGYGNLFDHGIQNIDQVTNCIGCIYNPSSGYMSAGTYVDGDGYKVFNADRTTVQYLGTTYMSSGYGTQKSFIIEYTKTTD